MRGILGAAETRGSVSGNRPVGAGVVVACGVVELMSWGSLYYAVPVLLDRITAAEGWSTVSVTATYSAALVVSALLSPWVGRYVDAHGPCALVSGGVLLGAAGLLVVALAPTLAVLAAGMLVVGVGQAATLYPPVFAALTIWFGDRSAGALTVVSLFGGISSTVFAPVLAPVAETYNWRPTLLGVAAAFVLVTLPVAWWGMAAAWRPSVRHGESAGTSAIVRSARFRWLQVSMLLVGLSLYGVTLTLIPLAVEQGHSYAFAAVAFGLVGAGQVAGRLLYLPLSRLGGPRGRTLAQVAASIVVVAGLAVAAPSAVPLVLAALAAGAVRGVHTLATAMGVSDRWGAEGFGAMSGHFIRPVALAIAAAPFLASVLAVATGTHARAALVLAALTALGLLAARRT
jgi:MFS family permease